MKNNGVRLFTVLARSSEKRPWLVVTLTALITVFLAVGFLRLETEFSMDNILPQHYESVKVKETVRQEFGGIFYENVLVVADDVTSSGISGAIIALSPRSLEEGGIKEGQVLRVETYLDAMKMTAEAQGITLPSGFLLGAAVQQFLATPYAQEQIMGKLISQDGEAALIRLQLNPQMSQSEMVDFIKKLESYLTGIFGAEGADVFLSGQASLSRDSMDTLISQSVFLFLIAVLFIMLVLYMTFRRVSDVFLLMFATIVGIIWVIGLMGWMGMTYTVLSAAVMPLMLGINIAYVIHILSRYYEEREEGGDIFYSTTTAVKTVGVAVFLAAITTVFGFMSFTITDLTILREFGIVCMIGITFSFLLALTLLPAVIVIRDRRKKAEQLQSHLMKMRKRRRESRYGAAVDRALVASSMTAYRHHWLVFGFLVAFIAFTVFSFLNLRTEADVRAMVTENSPSESASEVIASYLGPQDADLILVHGDVLVPENLNALLELENEIAVDNRNRPDRKGYLSREGNYSIADIVAIANGGSIPETRDEVNGIIAELAARMDVGSWVTEDGDYAILTIRSGTTETQDDANTKIEIIRDAATGINVRTGLDAEVTGINVFIADLLGNIVPTQLETSGLALVLCLLILIIIFRSFFFGLVTLVVVICGMSAELVFLFLMGWPLDIMTVLVASLVIGAGIDFGIHVTHRFREQHREHEMTLEESVRTTVLHVGRALIAGALTTAGVFGILGFSNVVILRHFGWTTAVGLLAALIGSIFILPSLLVILQKMSDKKRAGEVCENEVK